MDDPIERIATNLRKGVLEFGLLGLLVQRDMYGLELAEELKARELISSDGSLYPLIARLRDNGLIEPVSAVESSERPRRYYGVTAAGRAHLDAFAHVWAAIAPTINELLEGRK
ncbi:MULTISPECIES: PadR family transcriptional regulator [Microbacterium]|uniref:PadR family transcriptional regulator n=1 Tax=Microbacterium TaxID=33882 RepID=UPI0028EAE985|nr:MULTISPECIES: PadR family transcriptional regulator [Microbacterium]